MQEGHKFKATDFRGGDSSLPPLKPAKRVKAPQRPIRPRRGIRKQAEPGNLSDKEQELKEWIRVELKTQLGKLRNEIFAWLHHDRRGSFTVPQNKADGKTNRDNSHADPTGMEVPKKQRPYSDDGIDDAGKMWVDSMAGEGPSFSKSENIPEVDVSTPIGPETVSKPAKPTLPEPLEVFSVVYQLFVLVSEVYMNTDLFGHIFRLFTISERCQGKGGDESPISGLNLLAEEVEKGTWSDNVYRDPQENTCRMLTVWPHPESYVLPPETPPEDDPITESRTPDVGMTKRSRYLTRSSKKAELEGKCIPISSTKKDDLQTKRIPRRSIKIGGVYTPDKRLKILFQSCKKPKYTDLEKAQFQEFQKILRENPEHKCLILTFCLFSNCWEFEIVIGIHVSNQFFLSLARPTNWVITEFLFHRKTPRRNDKKVLLVDVDRVYAPLMWGIDHCVGLVINLTSRQVEILDCNIPHNESDNDVNKHMAYLHAHCLISHPKEDQAFSWVRPDNIYFNERSGDCGPFAVKFLEMYAPGYSYEDMGQIDDNKVDIFRQKYAMDTYEEFIGNAKVQNDG
ncbi:hypothetical protein Bca52824_027855 [Brassica carinata]|uniref:Ubiquitin-like protease family profile domain-containing protein n=1 Tax=Brassica carinata TaxID=52824 RepID=A0A8X8ANV5_BRACI|nr:hypothetical protein Bca52824_027855 [Brassica carinata]